MKDVKQNKRQILDYTTFTKKHLTKFTKIPIVSSSK